MWRTADCRVRCRCVTCEDDGDSASSLHRGVTHRTRNFQRGGRRQASAAMLARAACHYEEAEADPHPRPFKLQVCSRRICAQTPRPALGAAALAGAGRTSCFSFYLSQSCGLALVTMAASSSKSPLTLLSDSSCGTRIGLNTVSHRRSIFLRSPPHPTPPPPTSSPPHRTPLPSSHDCPRVLFMPALPLSLCSDWRRCYWSRWGSNPVKLPRCFYRRTPSRWSF